MAAKRRRKACRGQVEDDLLANARWISDHRRRIKQALES